MTMELTPATPKAWQPPRAKTLLFIAISAMYLYVLWTNETFLFDQTDPEWQHIAPFQTLLLPHGVAAALALFLAPFQFSERLRRKYVTVHKTCGYLYIAGCYIGAPIGLYIQWIEEKMGTFSRSFTIATAMDMALWMFATTMALIMIRQGKIQQHRQWMTRSFACALIFLEVRTIWHVFALPESAVEIIIWACIAAAFPLADLVLQIDESRRTARRPARA
jgi:uncharacterized membrane protein